MYETTTAKHLKQRLVLKTFCKCKVFSDWIITSTRASVCKPVFVKHYAPNKIGP